MNNGREITIVTAFFKIDRGNWKGFERTDEQYLDYFKVWAKLKNKIVVYVETDELKDRILSFRDSLGLADQTLVNIVHNCFDLDSELFMAIKSAAENPVQQLYRLRPENPDSCNSRYNYVQLIKSFCVCDAIQRGQASGMVAWLDFGYNHGGSAFSSDSDFNYLWTFDFPEKINLTTIQDIDDRPIFDIALSMDTYTMGGSIIAPDYLWPRFWQMLRKACLSLSACGLTDDDQTVMLMAYREDPDLFELWPMKWSMQLYEFGGKEHLKLASKFQGGKPSSIRRVGRILKHKLECYKLSRRIFRHMSKKPIS